jgi:hypothetical protein
MLAVTFLSFTAYLILISQDSPSGYYSSIARFWEFSIGALFSFGLTVRAKNKINLLFLGALLFLVASFFVLSISQIRVVSVLFVIATGYLLNLSVIGQLPKMVFLYLQIPQ